MDLQAREQLSREQIRQVDVLLLLRLHNSLKVLISVTSMLLLVYM
jgi:hypothetical protein